MTFLPRADEALALLDAEDPLDGAPAPAPPGFMLDARAPSARAIDRAVVRAKGIHDMRRRRERLFGACEALFRDPAWDIMLDLFIQTSAGHSVCVTSAAIASRMPQTTGLRWVRQLARCGLVRSVPDPCDARRAHLQLTDKAVATMVELLG